MEFKLSDTPKEVTARRGAEQGTLVDEAYESLRHKILHNELPPGTTALEAEIAADLGMSRTPVREALIRLEQEDLVEILPRRGIRVVPVTLRDLREINEVLACLEVQAVERVAARRLSTAEIATLDEAIAAMDAALEAEDMDAWAAADFRFHTRLIELCGNRHLVRTAMQFLDKAHRARILTLPLRRKPVYSNSNHAAVVEAIRRGDPETAREIHLAHKRRWTRELDEITARHAIAETSDD